MNCQIYGCGAANIGTVCAELNETHFTCQCPLTQNPTIVKAGDAFPGCPGSTPPTHTEVVANLNVTNLQIFIINRDIEVVAVIAVKVGDSTMNLNVTVTVPIDGILQNLREAIASFLGTEYTANDISIVVAQKKRASTANLIVTVGGQVSPGHYPMFSVYVALGLLLATLLLV